MNSPLPDGGAPPGFALGRVLVGAAVMLRERRRAMLHALVLPATVLFGHSVLETVRPELAASVAVGVIVLLVPLQTLLSVNVQRLTLLGPGAVPPLGVGPWGLREWRYLGWTWLQWSGAGFAMLLFTPLSTFGAPGWAVVFAVGAWVAGRLALMLPGIAIDRPLSAREGWRLGQGAGARLAVLAVGVPVAGFLLLAPLGTSELLPVRLFGTAASLLVNCWYTAALAMAWRLLLEAQSTGPVEVETSGRAVELAAGALRGVLHVRLARPATDADASAAAAEDALAPYAGRLRGLVVELDERFEHADPALLDAQLEPLAALRTHGEHFQRVALLAPTVWAPVVDEWGQRFEGAPVRWFPPLRRARAVAWAAGEESD